MVAQLRRVQKIVGVARSAFVSKQIVRRMWVKSRFNNDEKITVQRERFSELMQR